MSYKQIFAVRIVIFFTTVAISVILAATFHPGDLFARVVYLAGGMLFGWLAVRDTGGGEL